jgi:hypothetical protein
MMVKEYEGGREGDGIGEDEGGEMGEGMKV